MRIAIASGKGGTGKTLVATNLAWLLADSGQTAAYVDCDVEAPNGSLFVRAEVWSERRVTVPLPTLSTEHCSGCGECQRVCRYHAILAVTDKVLVFPELCHSCGGCVRACPDGVLGEVGREVGTLYWGRADGLQLLGGRLDVGEVRASPLIDAVLDACPTEGTVVVDAPPGTSCSAVAALRGADHVVLVTEPTPFGLHDLGLAAEMCQALGLRTSAVINRSDLGGVPVGHYLRERGIPVLAEIPFARDIADAYAHGALAATRVPAFRRALEEVTGALLGAEAGGGMAGKRRGAADSHSHPTEAA
jgi:MinD superfamily P-loop ATPase